jgi:hypothetical protein
MGGLSHNGSKSKYILSCWIIHVLFISSFPELKLMLQNILAESNFIFIVIGGNRWGMDGFCW